MPLIRSIEPLADGVRITTSQGVEHTITSDDIPPATKVRPIADVEDFAEQFLSNKMGGANVAIHIITLVPLVCRIAVSDQPITDPLWWDITRGGLWHV